MTFPKLDNPGQSYYYSRLGKQKFYLNASKELPAKKDDSKASMKFSDLGEFGFINRIARHYPIQLPYILKGIGDDAAVISFSDDVVILLTADQLIEGFHFRIDATEGKKLGAKALAVNLSDIAAMGGYPIGYTVSLGIPSKRVSLDFLDAFYEGITSFGKTMGVALIGGDTSESGERFFISLALLGKASKGKVIYRSGGKDGDFSM